MTISGKHLKILTLQVIYQLKLIKINSYEVEIYFSYWLLIFHLWYLTQNIIQNVCILHLSYCRDHSPFFRFFDSTNKSLQFSFTSIKTAEMPWRTVLLSEYCVREVFDSHTSRGGPRFTRSHLVVQQ